MAIARAVNTMGLSLVMSFLGVYVVETPRLSGLALRRDRAGRERSASRWPTRWAGNLSDRIGRRPLITGSLLVRIGGDRAGSAPRCCSTRRCGRSALNMLVSSTLRGCFEPVAYALVADVCAPDQRIAAFGLQRMGTNVGWSVGPALGGLLALFVPYGVVFYVAVGRAR